jgi:hypothetical protein
MEENPIDKKVEQVSAIFSTSRTINGLLMIAGALGALICSVLLIIIASENHADRITPNVLFGGLLVLSVVVFFYAWNRNKRFKK